MPLRINKKYIPLILFCFCLLTRISFKLISGANNFELFPDAHRYDQVSELLIQGKWSMDVNAYIIAPLYPLFLALAKMISGNCWEITAVTIQFLMISLSAIWIYRLSFLLSKSEFISTITALIYILYPLTLWYNFTLVQETLFQSLFIGSIYYLVKSGKSSIDRDFILSIILLALSILTKSHIIIALPFLAVWILKFKTLKHLIQTSLIVIMICMPNTILNYLNYNIVSLSSSGSSTLLLLGHSDQTYPCLINTAGQLEGRHAQGCDADFVFEPNFDNESWATINKMNPQQRFKERKKMALNWIKNNPDKYIDLKLHGLLRFLKPGLDRKQYQFHIWLTTFLMGMLIYIPAIIELTRKQNRVEKSFKFLCWILVLTVFLIFMIFLPINRFRVVTLEPALIVLAGIYYGRYIKKWLQNKYPTAIT